MGSTLDWGWQVSSTGSFKPSNQGSSCRIGCQKQRCLDSLEDGKVARTETGLKSQQWSTWEPRDVTGLWEAGLFSFRGIKQWNCLNLAHLLSDSVQEPGQISMNGKTQLSSCDLGKVTGREKGRQLPFLFLHLSISSHLSLPPPSRYSLFVLTSVAHFWDSLLVQRKHPKIKSCYCIFL